jgi:hypothetical protein
LKQKKRKALKEDTEKNACKDQSADGRAVKSRRGVVGKWCRINPHTKEIQAEQLREEVRGAANKKAKWLKGRNTQTNATDAQSHKIKQISNTWRKGGGEVEREGWCREGREGEKGWWWWNEELICKDWKRSNNKNARCSEVKTTAIEKEEKKRGEICF